MKLLIATLGVSTYLAGIQHNHLQTTLLTVTFTQVVVRMELVTIKVETVYIHLALVFSFVMVTGDFYVTNANRFNE